MKKTVRTIEFSIEQSGRILLARRSRGERPASEAHAVKDDDFPQPQSTAPVGSQRISWLRSWFRIPFVLLTLSAAAGGSLVIFSSAAPRMLGAGESDLPGQTFTVTTAFGSGAGSLRQAILDANASPGADMIVFNIPGGGPFSQFATSPLPDIVEPVVIDATTQPGYAGVPLFRFDAAQSSTTTFNIVSGGTTIKGFAFTEYSGGTSDFIVRLGGGNNVIAACTFGIGDTAHSSTAILIDASNNNRVGGSTPAERNYLAQNRRVLIRNGSTGNRIVGNWFGADTNGTPVVRTTGYGVRIENSPGNFVGGSIGTTPGGACTGECNSIAGAGNGVEIVGSSSSGNKVSGNVIGLLADGMTVNANVSYGVRITDAPNNIVGGTTAPERNVLTGSSQGGVRVENAPASGNVVSGNYIGVKTDGVTTGGSTTVTVGVLLNSVSNTRIGGLSVGERNLISGNNSSGITVQNSSTNNVVQGNYIGTDSTGMSRSTTRGTGIAITTNSSNNTIGGSLGLTAGGPCTGACNVISGNGVDGASYGVFLFNSNSNTVGGNYIGVNATGANALLNGITPDGTTFNGGAIQLVNANSNLIGSLSVPTPAGPSQLVPTVPLFCIQNDEGYVLFDEGIPAVLEAVDCATGLGLAGAPFPGSLTPNPSGNIMFRSTDGRITVTIGGTSGGATVRSFFADENDLHVDGVVNTTNCMCPEPSQITLGRIELTGIGGDSNNNRIRRNLHGRKADGSSLNSLFSTNSDTNVLHGNNNRVESVRGNSGPTSNIKHANGTGNSVSGSSFKQRTPNIPIDNAPGAQNNIGRPSAAVTREQGRRVNVSGASLGFIPGQQVRFRLLAFGSGVDQMGNPVTHQVDMNITIDAVADGAGVASFNKTYDGDLPSDAVQAAKISGAEAIGVTATIVTTGNRSNSFDLLVDILGSTSEMSEPAIVPAVGTPTPTATPTATPSATPTATPSVTPTPAGFESDVAPRMAGDGAILTGDVVQMRRFVTGIDTPDPATNEFQRADAAPRGSMGELLGDGLLGAGDVTQARRYAAGLDPLTPAGGPASPAVMGRSEWLRDRTFDEPAIVHLRSAIRESPAQIVVEVCARADLSAGLLKFTYDRRMGRPSVTLTDGHPNDVVVTVNDTGSDELIVLIDSLDLIASRGITNRLFAINFTKPEYSDGPSIWVSGTSWSTTTAESRN